MGKKIVLVLIGVCLVNLAYLDWRAATQKTAEPLKQDYLISLIKSVIPTPTTEKVIAESAAGKSPDATPTSQPAAQPATHALRESFVAIGNGSFHSEYEWADVPGAQVTIDGNSYGRITSAVFEATVNEPNGAEDVWLRLYNVTDAHPVWNSEMFYANGSATRFLVSPQITIEPKATIYQVQMKTQFQTNASLDLSRIHLYSY